MGKDASVPSLCSLGFEPTPDNILFIVAGRMNLPPPSKKNRNKTKNQFSVLFIFGAVGFFQRSGTCPDMQQ